MGQSGPLFFEEITKDQANGLIGEFGHPLGAFNRPFGYQAWGLAIDGKAVAVAVSGSTVGKTSAGYGRYQVVELARIARHPDHPGVTRVMLRLWRDYLGPRWDYWATPVDAAVSYALPGKEGNLYRFDGWEYWGLCKPWSGGGDGYSNPSQANEMGDGIKKLYFYQYPSAGRDIAALLAAAGFAAGRKSKKRPAAGFIVTNPSPGLVRVRYHSPSRVPAADERTILTAYAGVIRAHEDLTVIADSGDREVLVAPSSRDGRKAFKPRPRRRPAPEPCPA